MRLNIFITNSKSGAFFEIATGWINAFRAAGHNAVLWDGNTAQWRSTKPDIYIGCSGWRQTILKNTGTKVAIHVNPYCDEIIQIPGGPLINESAEAIRWTAAQNPSFVFGYGLQEDMNKWWLRWQSDLGIRPVGMPNAADTTKYYSGCPTVSLVCDIGWVGGYWGYKAINIDRYLIPVIKKHKSIWFGWSGPKRIWKGQVTQDKVIKLFHSAKVCPVIVEPHTTKYGIDVPERIFKLAACGALIVADPCAGIKRFFSDGSLILASTPKEYMALCDYWIAIDPERRQEQARKLQREVLSKHTYLHRAQKFLKEFGYEEEAAAYDSLIKKLLDNIPKSI